MSQITPCWVLMHAALLAVVSGCAGWGSNKRPPMGPMQSYTARGEAKANSRASRSISDSSDQQPFVESEEPPVETTKNAIARTVSQPGPRQASAVQSEARARQAVHQAPVSFDPFTGPAASGAKDDALPVITETDESAPAGAARAVIRGQTQGFTTPPINSATPGTGDYLRYPMQPSGAPIVAGQNAPQTNYQPFIDTLPPPNPQDVPLNGPNNYAPIQPGPGYATGPICSRSINQVCRWMFLSRKPARVVSCSVRE